VTVVDCSVRVLPRDQALDNEVNFDRERSVFGLAERLSPVYSNLSDEWLTKVASHRA
jgi:hypothetical protein